MHGLKYFVKIAQFVISIKFYCNWCSNFISDNYSSSTATQIGNEKKCKMARCAKDKMTMGANNKKCK